MCLEEKFCGHTNKRSSLTVGSCSSSLGVGLGGRPTLRVPEGLGTAGGVGRTETVNEWRVRVCVRVRVTL
jgi:hypothetical protein